ncbi:unnamed protein product [Urochloa humidicola]
MFDLRGREVEEDPVEFDAMDNFESQCAAEYDKFFKRLDLEKSEHLKDESFAVRCDIGIINQFRIKEETTPINLRLDSPFRHAPAPGRRPHPYWKGR